MKVLILVGALILLAIPVCLFPEILQNDPSIVWALSLIAPGWTLFLLSTLISKPVGDFFGHSLLSGMGRITYGMYVYHILCITLASPISRLFPQNVAEMAWIQGVLFAFLLTLGMAALSWNLLEKPSLRRKGDYSRIVSGFASAPEVKSASE